MAHSSKLFTYAPWCALLALTACSGQAPELDEFTGEETAQAGEELHFAQHTAKKKKKHKARHHRAKGPRRPKQKKGHGDDGAQEEGDGEADEELDDINEEGNGEAEDSEADEAADDESTSGSGAPADPAAGDEDTSAGESDGQGSYPVTPGAPGGGSDAGYWEPGVCGDGATTWWSEQCDDGNTEDGDGCSSNCWVEDGWVCDWDGSCRQGSCGDGYQDGYVLPSASAPNEGTPDGDMANEYAQYIWEECDDGNTVDGDGCSASCVMEPGYACTDAGQACTAVFCGDGRQDSYAVEVTYGEGEEAGSYRSWTWEECDDGNTESGDGCSPLCGVETGFACDTPGAPCRVVACGDGYQDAIRTEFECTYYDYPPGMESGGMGQPTSEAVMGDSGGAVVVSADEEPTGTIGICHYYEWEYCDDGNTEDGDGCSASCNVEERWVCGSAGEPCRPVQCGDGIVDWEHESCEDGNLEPGDGCSAECGVEAGWTCDYWETACRPIVCGDGLVDWQEEDCDDGNSVGGDGCSTSCLTEPGWACYYYGEPCTPVVCGDGQIDWQQESCDDGNTESDDGCDANCQAEPGYECDWGMCWAGVCGDGVVDDGEECDDGNTTDGDECTNMCMQASCGDGIKSMNEDCDDGNSNDSDACNNACQLN